MSSFPDGNLEPKFFCAHSLWHPLIVLQEDYHGDQSGNQIEIKPGQACGNY